jgi:hypothetical protein
VTKAANATGSATTFARSDHKHDVTTAATASIGSANAEGSATSLARSDHNHQVTALTTSTGPTVLTIGAITDGQVLTRSGSTIVGSAGGGGGSKIHMWMSLAGNASSVNGEMQMFNVSNSNPGGVFSTTSSGDPGIANGNNSPMVMPACTLVAARIRVAHAAVSTGTFTSPAELQVDVYTANYSTRTSRATLNFTGITSAGTFNNLGGNNFGTDVLSGLSHSITAGDLIGAEFVNQSGSNSTINAVGGLYLYLEFDLT